MERVTFHNPENGFCVLRVEARGENDLITVVGRIAMITAGEFIQASGDWVNDRTHGQQFRAAFLKTSAPTSLEGIERYLASGLIRGIGPIYAKRLVHPPIGGTLTMGAALGHDLGNQVNRARRMAIAHPRRHPGVFRTCSASVRARVRADWRLPRGAPRR